MTFSSADYPLFLIAVFSIYALTRLDGAAGRVARMAVLVLLGDLVYLLLSKDVGALWDPLGAITFAQIAQHSSMAPVWHLGVGALVLAGAIWIGWQWGQRLDRPRAQTLIAWVSLGLMVLVGGAVMVLRAHGEVLLLVPGCAPGGDLIGCGRLEAVSDLATMSGVFEDTGHLLFLVLLGVAVGASQTRAGRPFGRVLVLLIASTVFYHAWAAAQIGAYRYLMLVLLGIVVGDFLLGLAIDRSQDPRLRKLMLVVSLVANLGVLALFKYADFFMLDVLGLDVEPLHLILPAGISFHTFQSMSYTIDVYRRQIPATRSVVQFATFVLFFPQLVAGPIVRAHELLPQMDRLPPLDRQLAADGVFRILVGLFKKIAIADLLGHLIVDRVFAAPERFSGLEVLIGVWAYALQIYLDFSAYSDIAIGSAQLLGFKFPENFRTPYRSANLQEFWRRWHLTLSSWLRDYLYIPLGGGRGGALATYRNLIITMLLGGLWHGASWTYITWGALHGFGLAVTRMFQRRAESGASMRPWLVASLLLALVGAAVHLTLLADGDHGVLLHIIIAWAYASPLWAATTTFLTLQPEPGADGAAPSTPPSPANDDAPEPPRHSSNARTVAPRPAARAKPKGGKAKRKHKRRQRGSVRIPRAVAIDGGRRSPRERAVRYLRRQAAGLALAALIAFIEQPPSALWFAVTCWATALIADVVERAPDLRLALRWTLWAAKRAIAVVLTFHYVCLAWVFFRAQSFESAGQVLNQLATLSTDTGSLLPQVEPVLAVALLAHFFSPGTFRWARQGFPRLPSWAQAAIMVGSALALRSLASTEAPPFIYFQF